MFSNISDAWNHDPVKEMTDKLSKGAFQNTQNTNKRISTDKSPSDFKWKTKEITNSKNNSNLSDGNSLSLLSDNTIGFSDSDFGSFAPIIFNKKKARNNNSKQHIDTDDTEITNSSDDLDCNYSVKHLKKCIHCNDKIKKLISNKVNKKFDEMILDNKIKQLQNAVGSGIQTYQPLVASNMNNDSWKQTLIIVVAVVIIIFVIFLMAKTLNK